jgi:hypothetical protein
MNDFSRGKNWQFIAAVAVLLISGASALRAQVPAGPDRPPAVPEGYVITPMGYFHPSCVLALAKGDTVHNDEKVIEHKDGSFESIPACAFPQYAPDGQPVWRDGEGMARGIGVGPADIDHSYIELATMKKKTSYFGELRANWIVPPDPTSEDDQTVFFFPGLEDDDSDSTTILQPVLGWNATTDFPNVWTLASWNCCVNGTVQHSAFISTAVGDDIFGQIFIACKPGSKYCSEYSVNTVDSTTGQSTELKDTSAFGLTFNWAFAGALEVYNISQCSDYPSGSDGSTQFFYLGLFDENLQVVTQHWVDWKKWQGLTPQCNYGIAQGTLGGLPYVTLSY